MHTQGRVRTILVALLAGTSLPLAAQSMLVLSSGEDARRCSMAAETAANLRTASSADLADCNRALDYDALNPRDRAGTYVNRGIIESTLDLQNDAMVSYNQARKTMPELPEPYVGRGNVLFLSGDTASAIAEYDHALALGISRRHVALLNRGMALEARGQLDAAERDYREALQIAPKWTMAQSRLDRVLAKRKTAAERKPPT